MNVYCESSVINRFCISLKTEKMLSNYYLIYVYALRCYICFLHSQRFRIEEKEKKIDLSQIVTGISGIKSSVS